MIVKRLLLGVFLAFGLIVHAQSIPLKDFLEEAQKTFKISFSYRDKDLKDRSIPWEQLSTIDLFIEYFQSQTPLVLKEISANQYAVAKGTTTYPFCFQFIDAISKEPITGIEVSKGNEIKYSDLQGRVTLLQNEKNGVFSVAHTAYGTREISMVSHLDCTSIYLEENPIVLDEVLINYQTPGVDKLKEGGFSVNPSGINLVSGAINADVFTVLEKLPGILNFDESIGDLHVHGGTPDQNQVLWNEIRLYQNAHVFGGISSINPFGVDQVQFYKSGVRSLWGDHTSGLIQMHSGEQRSPQKLKLGISLLDFYAGIPFQIGENFSATFSGRASIPNELELNSSNAYLKQLVQNSKISNQNSTIKQNSYHDFTFASKYLLNSKNAILVSALRVSDVFKYDFTDVGIESLESLQSHNEGYRVGWEYKSNRLKSQLNFSGSNYHVIFSQNTLEEGDELDDVPLNTLAQLARENKVNLLSLKWVGYVEVSNFSQFDFGIEWIQKNIHFNRVTETSLLNESLNFNSKLLDSKALFVNYEFNNLKGLLLNSGIRINHYNILDVVRIEPRLSLSQEITNHLNGYFTYETKSQNAVQSQESVSSTIAQRNPLWIGVHPGIVPLLTTNQQTLGFTYTHNGFIFDLEGFYKNWKGITTLNYGYLDPNDKDYHQGFSKAKGVNLFVKKQGEFIALWGSYSFLDIKNKFTNINNNDWFTGNFSLKNSLKLGVDFTINKFQFGTSYSFHTGMPYSEPLGIYYDQADGNTGFEYNSINGQFLPSYNRLDASAKYPFKTPWFKASELRASLINITQEKNLLYKNYIYSASSDKIYSLPTYSLEPVFNVGLFVEL